MSKPQAFRPLFFEKSVDRRAICYNSCIKCSADCVNFSQLRVCHLWLGGGSVRFGIYACSPVASSFKATFTDMTLTECTWLAHNGQQPNGLQTEKGRVA